eukprot:216053_1
MSQPKEINIYILNNLNINFDDLSSIKPDIITNCKTKKLEKGQKINLQKTSKNAIKFGKIKYLAIYIKSNQNNTENTFINGISFEGQFQNPIEKNTQDKKTDIIIKKSDIPTFNNQNNIIEEHCNGKHYTQCTSMNRLLTALNHYSMLNIIENESLDKLINDEYQLINDYIHFTTHHSHELETINNDIIKNKTMFTTCDISSCTFTLRHNRRITKPIKNKLNPTLNFYKDIMDLLHFYIFHCFDVGLRIKNDAYSTDEKDENDQNEMNNKYFDRTFAQTIRLVSERTHNTKSFERSSSETNNKYNILVNEDQNGDSNNSDDTFIESLYSYLRTKNVSENVIKKLGMFIQNEEYETECIEDDIEMGNASNIAGLSGDFKLIQQMREFYAETKLSVYQNLFSIGYRFYYWTYYKYLKELPEEQTWNKNDHSGYKICDLYITPKYGSFKEEICHYPHFSLKEYKE